MKLSVISPTYNERENVGRLVESLEAVLGGIDHEILIVDDDSPDETWLRATEISQQDPRVRVLRRTGMRGLGFAVIDGFEAAAGEAVACIDADLQHDPRILPVMLRELEEGVDLVVGSRYVKGGGTPGLSWRRRLASSVATKMAQWAVGVELTDPMTGYFLLRKADFLRIRHQLNGEGFKILLEIVAALKPRRVREIPYVFGPRIAGQSKVSRKIVFAYLGQLLRLRKQFDEQDDS